ncbi:MAG TPA: SEC-C domain-containing protein, partial [Gemmatimonadales bacterium]|nr:SEC-C domain-containing protein [Gemmatimonadales bacterium]
MSSPTRNAPCPCGSGRKYKHCCLGPAPTSASPYSRADRERALTRLGKFASSAEFESYREAALELYWRLDAEPDERLAGIMDEALPAFFDWFALDLELERGTVVDRLLARQAHTLPSGEAEFLRRLRDSQVRLYEITRVRRNEGMTLADLWTGEIKDVRERLATGQLVPWDLIAA